MNEEAGNTRDRVVLFLGVLVLDLGKLRSEHQAQIIDVFAAKASTYIR